MEYGDYLLVVEEKGSISSIYKSEINDLVDMRLEVVTTSNSTTFSKHHSVINMFIWDAIGRVWSKY